MLTLKQRKFVEAYADNATAAALAAGYSPKTAYSQGQRLLKNVDIITAIKKRETKALKPLIATREERQKFWTQMMVNPDAKDMDKLRASELLGKSEGDFIERREVEVSGRIDVFLPEVREELLRGLRDE